MASRTKITMSTNSQETLKIREPHRRLSYVEKEEIRGLILKGFSLQMVALKLGLRKSTVYYHARPYCKKQTKLNIKVLSLKEQGYILGMFVGDGNIIMKRSKGQYGLKFALDCNKDQDIAQYLCLLFMKAGKKIEKRIEGNTLYLRTFSKKLVKFVSTYVSIAKQPKSRRNIKLLINSESWASDFKIGFISGLLDSDGHVYHNKYGKHYGAVIKTSNRLLGKQVQASLSDLKINTNIRVHEFKGTYQTVNLCYDIYIPSKEMWKFCQNLISVKHARYH